MFAGLAACSSGGPRETSGQPFAAMPAPNGAGAQEMDDPGETPSAMQPAPSATGGAEAQNPQLPVAMEVPGGAESPPAVEGMPPEEPAPQGVQRPAGSESAGFFVSGGRLYDQNGNDFVMRGINNPLAWFQDRNNGALAWLTQIASTGSNTVRLVWETDAGDPQLLRDAIERCLELHMVPMVELHDVTGGTNVDEPANMAEYYVADPVKQILLDHEDSLLVNIANEWNGADNIFVQAYQQAIDVLRGAGIRHTLVIDANGYGQRANTVLSQGQALLDADPQHNLLFSAHMYEEFRDAQTIRNTLQRAVDQKLPFIVGEFGFQRANAPNPPILVPYDVLLSESQRLGIGYLAWSWTGNSGGVEYLDLTARSGSADALSAWGDGVINGADGIRATAQPASIFLE